MVREAFAVVMAMAVERVKGEEAAAQEGSEVLPVAAQGAAVAKAKVVETRVAEAAVEARAMVGAVAMVVMVATGCSA